MFGWIDRIWHWGAANIGGPVVDFIRDVLHGLWGFLYSIFGNVSDAWNDMFTAGHWLWRMAIDFSHAVWFRFYHLLRIFIPEIIKYFERLFDSVRRLAEWIIRWIAARVEWLIHKIETEIAFVIKWVRDNIWLPLLRDIRIAWNWITTFGKVVWFYISHPDKLVDLIWDFLIAKLETEAWNIGHLLGNFFLGLVLHNIKRFALLIEDIIMAVL